MGGWVGWSRGKGQGPGQVDRRGLGQRGTSHAVKQSSLRQAAARHYWLGCQGQTRREVVG
jgi:hypothetical protein